MFFKNSSKNKKGFTMIEMLIVIAIVALVSKIVFSSFGSLNNRQALDSEISSIKSIIQKTRLESLNSKNGIDHGVIFGSTTLTMVGAGTTTSQVFTYSNNITLLSYTLGTSTIWFGKVTGLPNASGTLTYVLKSGSTVVGTSSFSVNGVGVIQ